MKKVIQIFYISIIFLCCKTIQTDNILYGEYYKKGKDYEYRLILQNDKSFELEIKYQDINPKCIGNWKFVEENIIFLQCKETSEITESLSSSYMYEREYNLDVISKKKLKFKGVILTKVK